MKAVHYILYTWLALTNYDKRVKRNILSILKRCILYHFVLIFKHSHSPSLSFVILLPSSSRGESAPWVFQDGPARIAALRPSTSTGTNSELRGFDVLTFMKCCKMLQEIKREWKRTKSAWLKSKWLLLSLVGTFRFLRWLGFPSRWANFWLDRFAPTFQMCCVWMTMSPRRKESLGPSHGHGRSAVRVSNCLDLFSVHVVKA